MITLFAKNVLIKNLNTKEAYFDLFFCDREHAVDAKVALEELISLNSPAASQPSAVSSPKLEPKGKAKSQRVREEEEVI